MLILYIEKYKCEKGEINMTYEECARIFKVFSDPKRVKIIDMLSNGELCACKILEEFQITQPTLSHDMKLMCDAGIIFARKEGKWMRYSLNLDKLNEVYKAFGMLILPKEYSEIVDCGCSETKVS